MKIRYEKKVELRGGKLIKDLAIGAVYGAKLVNDYKELDVELLVEG